jgi:hypothetical protein
MLCAIAERDVEPNGLDEDERRAWQKANPLPTLLVLLLANIGSDFAAIAFEGENGWWSALTRGERTEITPKIGDDGSRRGLKLAAAVELAELHARAWMRDHDTEPDRCGERTWRGDVGPSRVLRCTLPYQHAEAVHLASDGYTWRSERP